MKNNTGTIINMLLLIISITAALPASAQQIIKPAVANATSFAVIIDQDTWEHTKEAVLAYKNMLETKEQLGTYIVTGNWKKPEEVQAIIRQLATAKPALEGVVLVGKIPVAMVRNAQHMTTAFKMDEIKYPFEESSVASDRFYDDFDLRFRFIKQDEKRPLWFYYELKEEGPQTIASDIYSARVLSHQSGKAAYADISRFFTKAVAARQSPDPLNQLLAFTGYGYNSESLSAWSDEQGTLRELFPAAFTSLHQNRILNFRMDTAIKYTLLGELQRPGTDLAFLSEHGDVEKQYISEKTKIITPELADIRPAARMIVFNACYNGSYHHPKNIAGAYIFNEGNTIVTQGNTVNALQDKYALQLAGLLQEGIRVGIWNSQINTLEAHLIGDPTWRFYNKANLLLNSDLVNAWNKETFWKNRLNNASQAQRCLALLRLFRLNSKAIEQTAASIFDTANASGERMQCLSLLAARGGPVYHQVLVKAFSDPYEYIRRKAVEWAAKSGNDSLIAPIVSLILTRPNDERVVWCATKSLSVMNTSLVTAEVKKQVAQAHYLLNKDTVLTNWLKDIDKDSSYAAKNWATIQNKEIPEAKRIQAVRLLRNNNYHHLVPQLVQLAADNKESPAFRQQLIEALGWFSNSYQKSLLLKLCNQVTADPNTPEPVKSEAVQTAARLTQWQLL